MTMMLGCEIGFCLSGVSDYSWVGYEVPFFSTRRFLLCLRRDERRRVMEMRDGLFKKVTV